MSSNDGDDYVEELRMVRVPKGARRSKSKATPGYDRELLRDGDNLRGPSESRPATQEDVEKGFGAASWEEPSAPYESEPSFGQVVIAAFVQGAIDRIMEVARDPEVQALAIQTRRELNAKWRERRKIRRQKRVIAQVTTLEQQEAATESINEAHGEMELAEQPSEALSAEEYAELLRLRLVAQQVLEHTESRLHGVQVEDAGQLPAELREAHRAALEGNLRDLDPQVLELLGFVWDQDDTEAVPLANRELPPELTSQ